MAIDNKWLSKLTKDVGILAADTRDPSSEVIQIKSPSFNWMFGTNGMPEGKIATLYGPEQGGKSLLMQLLLIAIQKKYPEGYCILNDAEFAFNKVWFQKLGGDLTRLIVRPTNDPLKIFDYAWTDMLELIQDGCPIKGFAIDSVKSIKYPKDDKKLSTNLTMGGSGASYLGPAFKSLLPVVRTHNITTVLVQQVYEELDQYKKMKNPYLLPDGRALKHFSDFMIEVIKKETKEFIVSGSLDTIDGKTSQVGHSIRTRIHKNRVGAPERIGLFTLDYNRGIVNVEDELIELAKSLGVIGHPEGSSIMWAFAHYPPQRGDKAMREYFKANPKIMKEIEEACNKVSDEAVAIREKVDSSSNLQIDLEE
jgi:RecA/RadA recombinase